VNAPLIGQRYRGAEGHSGYLLRQASYEFRGAMELALTPHGLTAAQYTALSVLARACNTTPQAANGVLVTLERQGLIERRPHPTHGRILQASLTGEGQRRLEGATPDVRKLEAAVEDGFTAGEIAAVKAWLVRAAQRMERAAAGLRS
jgi:DNA-binding MarR family transcriptional regulator